jgi:hypothetical protein
MGYGKSIVITAYGRGKVVEKITVSLFDESTTVFFWDSNAERYCDNINRLALKGEKWISAKIVSENTQYTLDEFLPFKLNSLLKFDDRTIQIILREVDNKDIIIALSYENEIIRDKMFNNMTKRAAQIIKEDMESLGIIRWKDLEEAQKRILRLIRHLEETGEIGTPHSKWEVW